MIQASDSTVIESIVRVHSLYTDITGSIKCNLDVLEEAGIEDNFTNRPIYLDTPAVDRVVTVSVQSISRPAHLVPLCGPDSSCNVHNQSSLPHPFSFRCFALAGEHDCRTTSYMS